MPSDITFDLTFPHSCTVTLTELSGNGQQPPIYFPAATTLGGNDGLLLQFANSDGRNWKGCFAFGDYELCGVFSLPDPDSMCVVSKGTGYWVYVNAPEQSYEMPVRPIRDVRVLLDAQIILLADFASLSAFGSKGRLWSQQVCWDELKISNIHDGVVKGTGFDPTNRQQSTAEFAVELSTGRVLQSPMHQ
jgi:hypothetical protein